MHASPWVVCDMRAGMRAGMRTAVLSGVCRPAERVVSIELLVHLLLLLERMPVRARGR